MGFLFGRSLGKRRNRFAVGRRQVESIGLAHVASLYEVLREAGPRCAQAGVEVDAALDAAPTARVRPALLRRALRELVNAAIRAMPRGGRLAARVRAGFG